MGTAIYLVLGAGPVGQAVTSLLLERGARVRLASRSGRAGPAGARVLAVDATDPNAVARAADGTAAILNCLNPKHYHRWPQEWPPMAHATMMAAERTEATLVTCSNLYPYDPRDCPITATTRERPAGPQGAVRADMWAQAFAAHHTGRLCAAEVRSGNYLGSGSFGMLTPAVTAARAGKTAWVLGSLDQPHSFAFIPDVAATMVAVASTPTSWGRLWITPSPSAATARDVLERVSRAVGHGRLRVRSVPRGVQQVAGWFSPLVRATWERAPERELPFTIDASETTRELGVQPTPWDAVIADLAAVAPARK